MMTDTHTSTYTSPVDKLLTYGKAEPAAVENWPNYLELGLEQEHIPELIRMATDPLLNWAESTSLEVWAPNHAWRTLGQLRAESAIKPLLTLFEDLEDSDWVTDELPEVFGLIGPVALPILAEYIADPSIDEHARISATGGLAKIGTRWPEARSTSIEYLTNQLTHFTENGPELNGFLLASLMDLQATEALPVIEQAFAARSIDPSIAGDWEDVQIEFGLKSPAEIEQERAKALPETPFPSPAEKTLPPPISQKERSHREAAHKKARNKMASQSRKKNRKR